MARPRVFVSSTFYDLQHVRADLETFIRSFGFEAVMFERGVISFREGIPREDQCYAEVSRCDIVISIIGSSFGTEAIGHPGSISHNEMRRAISEGKQVYAFIMTDVDHAHRMYSRNKEKPELKDFDYGVDRRALAFIDEVRSVTSLGIHRFNTASEITNILREQWAGLFQELLSTREQVRQQRVIGQIGEIATKMEESLKNYGQMYRGVWGFAHPANAQLREILGVKYHVFFTNLRECDEFLGSFGYERKKPEFDDEHLKWVAPDGGEIWILDEKLFLKNGSIPIPPPRWDTEWIKHFPPPPRTSGFGSGFGSSDDDDIPF